MTILRQRAAAIIDARAQGHSLADIGRAAGKNVMGKSRKLEDPYLVFSHGSWEYRVLKSWQRKDGKPYARWFCAVRSPMTYDGWDMGDTYVSDVMLDGAVLEFFDRSVWSNIDALQDYFKNGDMS